MMNFMMTMMVMQISRAKRIIKMLERLLKKEHLYTDEELKNMKAQLRVVKEELSQSRAEKSKGFGS